MPRRRLDAPNQFVIDIQPDQTAVFKDFLAQHGESDITLSPMIRGRLIALNGRPIGADDYKDDNTKRLIEREFNLSYTSALPSDKRVVAGDWYGASKRPEISMEERYSQGAQDQSGRHDAFRRGRPADRRAGDELAQARLGEVSESISLS